MEAEYLALAIVDPQTLDMHPVEPDLFSSPRHREALKRAKLLHQDGRLTLEEMASAMSTDYVLGLPAITSLPAPEQIVHVLRDAYARRELLAVIQHLAQRCQTPTLPVRELISEAISRLLAIEDQAEEHATFRQLMETGLDHAEKAWKLRGILGTPTGWAKLDELIGGWEPEKLYFVSGRPGAGKTAFGLQAITEAARAGLRCYVSSQEMGRTQLALRILSQESRIPSERLRNGRLGDEDWPVLTAAAGALQGLPSVFDTRSGLTFDRLRASILRAHARERLGMVMIDYVQMIRAEGESKVYELEAIAYGLKALAKELKAPVVALSQLNRGAEADKGKPPTLAQMRGSGGLEQAADVVVILWERQNEPETVEVRVAKHRDGPTGKFPAFFNRPLTLFE